MMNRDIGIDVLRVISAFMVVGIHTIPLYAGTGTTSDYINMLLQAIVRSGLPIFFIISGAFLLTHEVKSISKWYITRFSSILIPFVAYAYIHYTYAGDLTIFSTATLKGFSTALLSSQTSISVHYWFIYVMIGLYLLTPALSSMMHGMSALGAKRAFILIMVIHAVSSNYQIVQYATNIPNIFMIPEVYIWMLYFICGGLLFKCRELFSFNMSLSMVAFGLLMTAVLTWLTPNKFGFTFQQYDVNVTMLIFTSGLFLLFSKESSFFSGLGKRTVDFISFFGKKTYGIYLIHILVLSLVIKHMPTVSDMIARYNMNIFMTIIVFAISCFFATFIDIPLEYIVKRIKQVSK